MCGVGWAVAGVMVGVAIAAVVMVVMVAVVVMVAAVAVVVVVLLVRHWWVMAVAVAVVPSLQVPF